MIFRPYYYYDRGCAAYLFGCGTLGKALSLMHGPTTSIPTSNSQTRRVFA
jgi:hypothetical protein